MLKISLRSCQNLQQENIKVLTNVSSHIGMIFAFIELIYRKNVQIIKIIFPKYFCLFSVKLQIRRNISILYPYLTQNFEYTDKDLRLPPFIQHPRKYEIFTD